MPVRYGLGVRIAGSHPAGPGSIPGNGNRFFLPVNPLHSSVAPNVETGVTSPCLGMVLILTKAKKYDEDGIRTHAGRAHWISSPTP